MPKAILALRSYPLALFVAMLLFVCTLLLATTSIGKITGGGDDEGSGLGGTGKSGEYGFGGTGGPRPFVGDAQYDQPTIDHDLELQQRPEGPDWQAPWFPREPSPQDSVVIPADMQPLVELQRNPVTNPLLNQPPQDDPDRLYILDDEAAGRPAPVRQLLEMANSDGDLIAPTVLELRLRVPEGPPDTGDIETFRMELATQQPSQPQPSQPELNPASLPFAPASEQLAAEQPPVVQPIVEQIAPVTSDAPNAGLAELDEQLRSEDEEDEHEVQND